MAGVRGFNDPNVQVNPDGLPRLVPVSIPFSLNDGKES